MSNSRTMVPSPNGPPAIYRRSRGTMRIIPRRYARLMSSSSYAFWLCLLASLLASLTASAQTPEIAHGTGNRLAEELNRSGTIFWADSPLQEALHNLAAHRHVPVWLDRRCDPSQKVSLTSQTSLADSLWQLSRQDNDLDIAWSEEVIYVGPSNAANQWATTNRLHRQRIGRLPRVARSKWLRKQPWAWPRLTNPQDLLEKLEGELQAPIKNGQWVTHDLWRETELPALPMFVRLELLLAGFGCTFDIQPDGQAVVKKMPPRPTASWKITIPPDREGEVQQLIQSEPGAHWSRRLARLQASWRTREAIDRELRLSRPLPDRPDFDQLRFTIRATNQPLEPFLNQLGKQLGLQVELSTEAKAKAGVMISFQVERVTVDELLKAILTPVDLDYVRTDTNVQVDTRDRKSSK